MTLNLFEAARQGHLERLEQLLATHPEGPTACAASRDADDCTALHWAALNNHLAACTLLIETGHADVNATGGELVATPVHWAARSGHVYIVALLVRHGAD
ncbi:hypothetical protein CXG81DRAFT_13110, partial [Caulochytrium protostelioides]